MVICGPCVVMMPSNEQYGGPFQRKDSRIPLPNSSLSAIQSFMDENRKKSKLPQASSSPYSSTSQQEIVSKPPSLSCLGKNPSSTNHPSLNVDSNFGQESRIKRSITSLPRYKPQKVESLVLANQQGKYVGTKHLKPVSDKKLEFCQPSIHYSLAKQGGVVRENILSSSKLPRKYQPPSRSRRHEQEQKSFDSSTPTNSERNLQGPIERRAISKKCISFEDPKLLTVSSRISKTFIPSPATAFLASSINKSATTNKINTSNRIPKSSAGGPATSSNIPRHNRQKSFNQQTRLPSTTAIINPTGSRLPSVTGANVDRGECQKVKRKGYILRTLNGRKSDLNDGQLKRKLSIKTTTSERKLPLSDSAGGFKEESTSSSGSEESPTEKNHQPYTINDVNNSSRNEWKDELKDPGFEGSTDILDFSIESGEESPCDQSMLEDEDFDLDDDAFVLENNSDDDSECDSDEGMTNQDVVTVINTGLMARSDDTIIDTSMNSSEENILESLPESELADLAEDKEGEEEEAEETEHEEEQESNPEASPDSSTDEFLVQSFQQLQQEIQDRKQTKIGDHVNSLNVTNTSRSRCFPNIIKKGSEASPPTLSSLSEDESDYIDIDCEVQPMPALNRPLVYGYGSRLPMRTRNTNHHSRYSFHPNHVYPDAEPYGKASFPSRYISKEAPIFPNMKETLWDHYLAKSKGEEIDRIETPHSTTDLTEKHCSVADDFYYDPEILLAQLSHPKSLNNATFSEYSTHIKSSIMERYALHHNTNDFISPGDEMEYGSCFELAEKSRPVSTNDPGYYSESDVTKLKKIDYKSVMTCESGNEEDEYDDYYPSYPTSRHHYLRHDPIPKDPVNFLPRSRTVLDSSECHYGCKTDSQVAEKTIQYSNYGHFENPLSKPLGVNPWLHLLPDITPPRTPLKDLVPTEYGNGERIRNSPSVTSLPLWTSSSEDCQGECPDKASRRKNFARKSMEIENMASGTKTTSSLNKSQKKSFLPNFFRKKKCAPKTNKHLSKTSKVSENSVDRRFSQPLPSSHLEEFQPSRPISSTFTSPESSNYSHFSPKVKQILRKSLADSTAASEKSNSSSSSSSKSSKSATSEDSVLTVISAKIS